MSNTYILYNPLAGNKNEDTDYVEKLKSMIPDKMPICVDLTTIHSYQDFLECVEKNDSIYLCGGDGTLNRFINSIEDRKIPCSIFYYGTGVGNDFLRDVGKEKGNGPFRINKYISDLPIVIVNGTKYRFVNNVGFGIDGYCCEIGDKIKETSDKPVNYTAIAIKGMLFHYRPVNATVTVDGKKYKYKRVWVAPTMKGRYYGGGMMPAPEQNRLDKNGQVSLMLMHSSGKLRTLMVFPSIFNGTHTQHTNMVTIHRGCDITVEFDRPVALQIDGETIPNVTSYRVISEPTSVKK